MRRRIDWFSARWAICIGFLAVTLLVDSRLAVFASQNQSGNGQHLNVLIVPTKRNAPKSIADDIMLELRSLLREGLDASKQYRAQTLIPSSASIKRALKEGLLKPEDLMEPYTDTSLRKIAVVLGAQLILNYQTEATREEIRTVYRLHDKVSADAWLLRFEQTASVPTNLVRKPTALLYAKITTDDITNNLGAPTNHSASLPELRDAKIVSKINRKRNPDQAKEADTVVKNIKSSGTLKDTPPKNQDQTKGTKPDPTKNSKVEPNNTVPTTPNNTQEQPAIPSDLTSKPAPLAAPQPAYEDQAARYRQTGDLANAILTLRKAINENPRDPHLRRLLVTAYQERKNPEMALTELNRAMELDPRNAGLYHLRGELLLARNDTAGAMKAFRDGAAIDPKHIPIQVSLGDVLLAENKFNEAIEAYRNASTNDDKSPLPHRRMARAYMERATADPKYYADCLKALQQARNLTPATETRAFLEDYAAIMKSVEVRLQSVQNEIQFAYEDKLQSRKQNSALQQILVGLRQRGENLADFLDKLPPAAGQTTPQTHFSHATVLTLQTIGFFRDYLNKGDDSLLESFRNGQVLAQRELSTASRRLASSLANQRVLQDTPTPPKTNPESQM